MNRYRVPTYFLVTVVVIAVCSVSSSADEVWTLHSGTSSLGLDAGAMAELGLTAERQSDASSPYQTDAGVGLALDPASDLVIGVTEGSVTDLFGRHLKLADGITFVSASGIQTVHDIVVVGNDPFARASLPMLGDAPYLELHRVKFGFDAKAQSFAIFSQNVLISQPLAEALGDPSLAGERVGKANVSVFGLWVGGDDPVIPTGPRPDDGARMGTIGPDMEHCMIDDFRQYGRFEDRIGATLANTSWNVGDEELLWHGMPSEDHPFIVMNMFRLKDDRFEQIGQSWIKHGFCALDSTQCGGSCSPTGCGTLGPNCTDTYGSGLNAGQNGLGPRAEINPWTGIWDYSGSHNSLPSHSHNGAEHRIDIHDADLDSAQLGGGTYYGESYYVCLDDVNVWNSAAYKPVTVSGSPGGTWSFGMSSWGTPPGIGFALDAWTGADTNVFGPDMPIIEFVSTDGRSVLRTKATDLGGNIWHYEYVIMNVDMDRKVGSFTVPLPEGTILTNVGFHAVDSYGEGYSNTPWTVTPASDSITWSTVDNPIRWGTLYNFRFDADKPPWRGDAEVGMYEPGTPSSVTVTAQYLPAPDCNGNNIADVQDIAGGAPDNNGNGIPDECEPVMPLADAEGPRYLAVQVTGSSPSFALYLTGDAGDPGVSCVAAYIQADGSLGPDPVFQDSDTWGTMIHVNGLEILPESMYNIQLDTGTPGSPDLGPPTQATTWMWGDVDNNGVVNFTDINFVVQGFQGNFTQVSLQNVDLHPSVPNQILNFSDINWDVAAFQGGAYLDHGIAPCP